MARLANGHLNDLTAGRTPVEQFPQARVITSYAKGVFRDGHVEWFGQPFSLMQLYERGMFQLEDPVSRFIPSWKNQQVYVSGEGDTLETRRPEQPMTMRHVLTHMSGLSYGAGNHPVDRQYRAHHVTRTEGETLAGFVEKLAQVPLHFDPGSRWMYSYSTDICGHLVEVLSGQRLEEYFDEHIFGPLGMNDTAFWVPDEKLGRLAANYQRQPDKSLKLIDDPWQSTYRKPPSFLSGGGGLAGTMLVRTTGGSSS